MLRVRFEDKLREAAGGEADAILKPVLGERLCDCLVARDHAATGKFGNDGASRDWPAAAVSFGKGNKPAGRHGVSRTRYCGIEAGEVLDHLATSVVIQLSHQLSSPDHP